MSKIILAEQASAPDTPGSGKVAIFVDTNGDLAWKDDAGNVIKIASAGAYTLTIPATGTAALRGVANTFTAEQTFNGALVAPGMKPASDSTTALRLQNAAGTAVLTVDTTNSKVDVAALKIGGVDVPYVTGTFTPALTFGGGATGLTYSSRTGQYTKIGDLVFVELRILLSAKGSSTGTAVISGLPFTVAPSSSPALPAAVFMTLLGASVVNTTALFNFNATTLALYAATAAYTSMSVMTDASFGNSSQIYIAGCYRV